MSKEEDETYPDEINRVEGEIRYWGDAKRDQPGEEIDVDSFYGNKRLAPEYDKVKTGDFHSVAPILFFKRDRSGYVRFLGLCALEAVTPDRYLQQFDSGTVWTPNYLYHLAILDTEEIPVTWIHDRALEGSDASAPESWQQWKETGTVSADIRFTLDPVDTTPDRSEQPLEEHDRSTAGRRYPVETETVAVSPSFRKRVFDLYQDRCILTEMEGSPLVTLPHIVPRSDAIEYAEDITNVVLLNWAHHVAFDSGLFTIDPDLRLWVNPAFETEDPHLLQTLHDRHGTQIDLPVGAELSTERIRQRNENLDWWPLE